MLRRLDRYVLAEITGPLALGFLIFTFIFLINVLFKSAELIIKSQVPVEVIGRLLLLSLPSIVVLTIPIAFLFSVVIAVGRLSADSELTAIRASGVSLFSLYRPILALSTVLAGLCVYLMVDALPKGNHALQKLNVEIITRSLSQEIQPRVPYTKWNGKVLYIFEAPGEDKRWKGVFLSDVVPTLGDNTVAVAEWGLAQALEDGARVRLTLDEAYNHQVNLGDPIRYNLGKHVESSTILDTSGTPAAAATSVKRTLREMQFEQLLAKTKDQNVTEEVRAMASVELHRKFSFPAACLVFGLFALPLGFGNTRGGSSSGFALSFVVILGYYVLLSWGEDLGRTGKLPIWFASWLANLIFLMAGLFLLARRNSDKSLMLTKLDQWIRENFWGEWLKWSEKRKNKKQERRLRRQHAARPNADLVLRLPDLRVRFPNSVDRYLLATYFRVLVIATLAGLTLYIVADVTERIDDILENQISFDTVFRYYQFKAFTIFYQISPFITLVTTLLCFSLLSRTNELTAFKASGISLYRMAVPVLLASAAVAGLTGWLQADILAAANSQVAELEAVIRDRPVPRFQRTDRRWLYGKGEGATHYLYNYLDYNDAEGKLSRLQVFKFDADYRLTDRLMVDEATYVEDGWWTFSSGWSRSFSETKDVFTTFDSPVRDRLPESPEFFRGEVRTPDEMTYRELEDYVEDLRLVGAKDIPPLEVQLHNKIAYPAISLVMALVGLPFAFRLGRKGALYGIGLALVLGIVLMIFLAFFSALGDANILPPLVAVWSPNVLFGIFSLYLFLGVQS